MLERRSALAGIEPFESSGLRLFEARHLSLLQVAAPSKAAIAILGKLPAQVGVAVTHGSVTLMKIGPQRFWVTGPEQFVLERELQGKAIVTPLSHSRTRLLLEGSMARALLARSAAIDFHPSVFKPGQFVMTGIHHTPVLIHCLGSETFHIYAMRTFALSVWEWLVDAAEGLG
jgi:sarcosine oxidase subunit gamma